MEQVCHCTDRLKSYISCILSSVELQILKEFLLLLVNEIGYGKIISIFHLDNNYTLVYNI